MIRAFLIALAAGSALASPAEVTVQLATDVVNHIRQTSYSHQSDHGSPAQPDIVRDASGRYRANVDCSGFVTWIVQKARPEAVTSIRNEMARFTVRKKWPQAYVWQHFFARLGGGHDSVWAGVTDLRSALPGDILSWCLDQHCEGHPDNGAQADNTGHVAIIAGAPTMLDAAHEKMLRKSLAEKDFNLPPDTAAIYSVPVIDSSSTRHYDDNTRSKTTGTSGVGRGGIYVAVDENGKPLGVQFPGGNFRYEGSKGKDGPHSMAFGIGRLLDPL